jgi:hypothetical protein
MYRGDRGITENSKAIYAIISRRVAGSRLDEVKEYFQFT